MADISPSMMVLGALGGGAVARVSDDWLPPELTRSFTLMNRTFTVRPSTIAAGLVIGASIAGVEIPGEALLLPMAAGALAYELTAEVGDDLAAMVLGLPPPGSPQAVPPAGGVPASPPIAAAFLPYPGGQFFYPGGVDDYALAQSLAGVR